MRIKKIIKMYEKGSVSVCGMRGRGKDLLIANVIVRRKLPYISNIDYGGMHIAFDYNDIRINNTYKDFIENTLKKWEWKYSDNIDIYLSDCGVYFPSQYCNELNKEYKELPTYAALSRQTSGNSIHYNSQVLSRVWDKLREQSDVYLLARRCWYLKIPKFPIVIQQITIYDKYESALERRLPLRVPLPIFANKQMRLERTLRLNEYESAHGVIKTRWLIYRNKSTYDTRIFKKMLEKGKYNEKTH